MYLPPIQHSTSISVYIWQRKFNVCHICANFLLFASDSASIYDPFMEVVNLESNFIKFYSIIVYR